MAFRRSIKDSAELQRILALPSYDWERDPEIEEIAEWLDEQLGKPKRTCSESCACRGAGRMQLRPAQAAALMLIHDHKGFVGQLPVGSGKTLITYLAGPLLEKQRVCLLVPAKLVTKTKRDFSKLSKHWVGADRMHILSYELLSRDRGWAELQAYRPDLLIADEAHKLKNPKAACTKRVIRYLSQIAKDCVYVDCTGTLAQRSIMEYWHRVHLAIDDGLQPLPRDIAQARDWSDALDETPSSGIRALPGALTKLWGSEERELYFGSKSRETTLKATRMAYRRRLMSAPGMMSVTGTDGVDMPILIDEVSWPVGPSVVEAFSKLREDWCLPDGEPVDSPAILWMVARCLVQGFYYQLDPPAPKHWLSARKDWSSDCRRILRHYQDIDSPLNAARAVDSGRVPWGRASLERWRSVRPDFVPRTVTKWIDDNAIEYCARWAKRHTGVIWTAEKALGERLQAEGIVPYYGSKGMCGDRLLDDETRSCAASIKANFEGRNLQYAFSKALIASPYPGGSYQEQLIGRFHREGQKADEVGVSYALGCYESWKVVHKAFRHAEFAERTTGQPQKLNLADVTLPGPTEASRRGERGDPLWSKENADYFDEDT